MKTFVLASFCKVRKTTVPTPGFGNEKVFQPDKLLDAFEVQTAVDDQSQPFDGGCVCRAIT